MIAFVLLAFCSKALMACAVGVTQFNFASLGLLFYLFHHRQPAVRPYR